jgi:hypothetical protein
VVCSTVCIASSPMESVKVQPLAALPPEPSSRLLCIKAVAPASILGDISRVSTRNFKRFEQHNSKSLSVRL